MDQHFYADEPATSDDVQRLIPDGAVVIESTPRTEAEEATVARLREALAGGGKYCITCQERGHTYLECGKVNFFDLLGATFGVPNLLTGESATDLRDRVASDLDTLKAPK